MTKSVQIFCQLGTIHCASKYDTNGVWLEINLRYRATKCRIHFSVYKRTKYISLAQKKFRCWGPLNNSQQVTKNILVRLKVKWVYFPLSAWWHLHFSNLLSKYDFLDYKYSYEPICICDTRISNKNFVCYNKNLLSLYLRW